MADILAAGDDSAQAAKRQKRSAVVSISSSLCERLRTETLHLCACDGVLLGAAGPFTHAPCSLLPYPFPKTLFSHSVGLAKPFNLLVEAVSRDTDWLCKTVRTTVGHDPFTRRLLELFEAVSKEGITQPLALSLNRSDYMIDAPPGASTDKWRALQVELNTVSVSFPSLAARMTELHRHSMRRLASDISAAERAELSAGRPALDAAFTLADPPCLPTNGSVSGVAAAIAKAHGEYCRRHPSSVPHASVVVLMVVQPNERNVIDQRGIEYTLWRDHAVPLVRMSLGDLHARAKLHDSRLRLAPADGAGAVLEASVVYFRAGYTPNDYPGEAEWTARGLLERSLAIKCPSIAQHLAGTKKVQQALAVTVRRGGSGGGGGGSGGGGGGGGSQARARARGVASRMYGRQ